MQLPDAFERWIRENPTPAMTKVSDGGSAGNHGKFPVSALSL